MRVIVIDPKARTVDERDIGAANDEAVNDDVRKIIGGWLEMAPFSAGYDDVRNVMWVDEEGLCHDTNYFFSITWGPQAYAGIGVLTGMELGEEGYEMCGCTLPIDIVRSQVSFLGERRIIY